MKWEIANNVLWIRKKKKKTGIWGSCPSSTIFWVCGLGEGALSFCCLCSYTKDRGGTFSTYIPVQFEDPRDDARCCEELDRCCSVTQMLGGNVSQHWRTLVWSHTGLGSGSNSVSYYMCDLQQVTLLSWASGSPEKNVELWILNETRKMKHLTQCLAQTMGSKYGKWLDNHALFFQHLMQWQWVQALKFYHHTIFCTRNMVQRLICLAFGCRVPEAPSSFLTSFYWWWMLSPR